MGAKTGSQTIVLSQKDAAQAEKSSRVLSPFTKSKKSTILELVVAKKSTRIVLPPAALKLLADILSEMGQGNAISVTPIPTELTTLQAADFLNVSHPFFITLLNKGKIRSYKDGSKQLILAKDLIRLKTSMKKKRLKTLAALSKQAQELNMGYD